MKRPRVFAPMAQGIIGNCNHWGFSTSAVECEQHSQDIGCHDYACDSCNARVGHSWGLAGEGIEKSRETWARVAEDNGWGHPNLAVQVWLNPDGTVYDAVSHRGLEQDIIIVLTEEELEDMESDD